MNIAIVSPLASNDLKCKSEILFSIYVLLQESNNVTLIGSTIWEEVCSCHEAKFKDREVFIPENYASLFGKLISNQLKKEYYDVIIFVDYFIGAYLVSNVPLIYIRGISSYMLEQTMRYGELKYNSTIKVLEELVMQKIDKLIDCPWTKQIHCSKQSSWDVWLDETCRIIEQVILNRQSDFYIPVYVINMKNREERRLHIFQEFQNKKEFEYNLVEASVHPIGAVGLWNSMICCIKTAKSKGDDVIVICEDDHFFTKYYSPGLLFKEITEAYAQSAEILSGGIGGFGQAIPVGGGRYRVDWFWSTQFIVVFSSMFDKMLNYSFQDTDTADGVISRIATNKMVIYPFISEQKDFGYSDVTQSNMEQKGIVREYFMRASKRLEYIKSLCL